MAQHHLLGKEGETMALEYLEKNGFRVLEKNWRYLKAEVDLIAMKDEMLVVIEVKTRATDYFGEPEEAVTTAKQKLLSDAANAFLQMNNLDHEVRFDIISIITNHAEKKLHHITDAFYPFSSELDG